MADNEIGNESKNESEDVIAIFCGDRNWRNKGLIYNEMKRYTKNSTIIEGEARGADKLSKLVAEELGLEVIPMRAEWEIYHKGAGPIRNQEMLDKLLSDKRKKRVVAFHNNLAESVGTKDMVTRAKKARVEVILIGESGTSYNRTIEDCCK